MEAAGGSDRIPYRIEIEDGPVLRCWEPRDAPLLKDAVDSSLEHLREWMPWAQDEPQELEIHVDPANHRSCRIPRRLGYQEEGVLRRQLPASHGAARRDAVIFSLLAEELAASPAALVRLRAFDCRGIPLL